MTLQEEFDASKTRLEKLSEDHGKAVIDAAALQIQLDTATAKVNKLREKLDAENLTYMDLEKRLETEQA